MEVSTIKVVEFHTEAGKIQLIFLHPINWARFLKSHKTSKNPSRKIVLMQKSFEFCIPYSKIP